MGIRVPLSTHTCEIDLNAASVPLCNAQSQRRSNRAVRPSVSMFPLRHPVLHGLVCECRTFLHRMTVLCKRGGTRQLQMGLVHQPSSTGEYLVSNKRTAIRIRDIQKLVSDHHSLSAEDCHLFLQGWDKGSEFRASSDSAECSEGVGPSSAFHSDADISLTT